MFDLVSGRSRHLPRHAAAPMLVSSALQFVVVGSVLVLPLLYVTDQIPEARAVMVFVASAPAPAPPPPPPPAPRPVSEVASPGPVAPEAPAAAPAPVTPPERLAAETPPDPRPAFDQAVTDGVPGGVPGGLAGAVAASGPPAPPPPAPSRAPVRVGGNIDAPELLFSVQPTYPPRAVQANHEGVVILVAIVDRDGTVSEVKILRSVDRLLDTEAERAVRQWRYSPLVLNGTPERFVLTVTLSFHLDAGKGGSS
jgi:protein TonB